MRRRLRKLIGTVVLLAFVCIYAVTAMLVAQSEPIHQAPGWAQGLFFGVVGLAWILPLMPLVAWMERPDADDLRCAERGQARATRRPLFQRTKGAPENRISSSRSVW